MLFRLPLCCQTICRPLGCEPLGVSYTFGSVVLAADSLCPKGCCCWVRPPWMRFVQAMLDQAAIWPVWTLFIWQMLSQPEAPGCQVLQELLPTGSQDCVLILNTHNHALQTHNPIIVCIHENTVILHNASFLTVAGLCNSFVCITLV